MAIGSNAIIGLDTSLPLDNLGLLSNESRSYSFDQRGNGYARGEGVGVLVLRPLKDAIDHNDTIRAVIRSSGSNQDGRTQGITQPSMALQQQLILDTYNKADLDLSLTRYVEAHGTGMLGLPLLLRVVRIILLDRKPVMFKVSLFEQEQQWEILLKLGQLDLFSETIGRVTIPYICMLFFSHVNTAY